nr:MAG TPA: hypothetical protein [Caudoviricetes sp.]
MFGEKVPSRPATVEATHGGVTVSVSCPREQTAQWAAWVLAVCRQNRWPEEVTTR